MNNRKELYKKIYIYFIKYILFKGMKIYHKYVRLIKIIDKKVEQFYFSFNVILWRYITKKYLSIIDSLAQGLEYFLTNLLVIDISNSTNW